MNIKDIDKISTSPRKGKKGFLKSLINLVGGGGGSSTTLVCNVTFDHQEGDNAVYCLNVDYDELVITPISNITVASEFDDDDIITAESLVRAKLVSGSNLALRFKFGEFDEDAYVIDKGSDNKAYFTIAGGK